MNLVRPGLTQLIDLLEITKQLTVTAVEETQANVVGGVEAVVRIGDKSSKQLVQEVDGILSQAVFSLRKLVDALELEASGEKPMPAGPVEQPSYVDPNEPEMHEEVHQFNR